MSLFVELKKALKNQRPFIDVYGIIDEPIPQKLLDQLNSIQNQFNKYFHDLDYRFDGLEKQLKDLLKTRPRFTRVKAGVVNCVNIEHWFEKLENLVVVEEEGDTTK